MTAIAPRTMSMTNSGDDQNGNEDNVQDDPWSKTTTLQLLGQARATNF